MIREVRREVEYVGEAISLLKHIGYNKSFQEMIGDLEKKYPGAFEKKKPELDLLYKIEADAKRYFASDSDMIERYFKNDAKREYVARFLLDWDEAAGETPQSVEELLNHVKEMSVENYCQRFARMVLNYASTIREEQDTSHVKGEIDVIKEIMKLDIETAYKYQLQEAFLNREAIWQELQQMIEKAVDFLQVYQEQMLSVINRVADYWEAELKDESFSSYMLSHVGNSIPVNPLGCILHITVLEPNQMGLNADLNVDGTYSCVDHGNVGILIGEDLSVARGRSEDQEEFKEYALQAIKQLSDKTKLDILMMIRDKSAYGTELAKATGVTSATISHHMSVLLENGLIRVEKVDNKTYYSSDKENIKKVLHYYEKRLLNSLE